MRVSDSGGRETGGLRRAVVVAALRIGAAGLVLVLVYIGLLRQGNLQEVMLGLRRASYVWVLAALLSVGVTVWIRAMRWRSLLAPRQASAQPLTLATWIAVGQVLNSVVPLRTGELLRAYAGGRESAEGRLYALGTIVAEKLLDLLIWLVLLRVTLDWVPLPRWVVASAGVLVAVCLLGAALLVFTARWSTIEDPLKGVGVPPPVARWLAALWSGVVVLREPGVAIPAVLWSLVLWAAYVFSNLAVLRALDVAQGLPAAVLVLVILQAGSAPPSTPVKIGVFEYLCALALGLLGVGLEAGLGYGIILHLVVLLPALMWCAPVAIRSTRWKPAHL